jgi:hypothetical protein
VDYRRAVVSKCRLENGGDTLGNIIADLYGFDLSALGGHGLFLAVWSGC